MNNEELDHTFNCEKCGARTLKGDMRYVSGHEVCEYCYDSFSEEERDEAGY